ncbi:hypothetical protein TWF173_005173 [Orbilia oligospora]|nr:hypothetical protein TWF173_005173 [Orbilia oligospora]
MRPWTCFRIGTPGQGIRNLTCHGVCHVALQLARPNKVHVHVPPRLPQKLFSNHWINFHVTMHSSFLAGARASLSTVAFVDTFAFPITTALAVTRQAKLYPFV